MNFYNRGNNDPDVKEFQILKFINLRESNDLCDLKKDWKLGS